MSSIAIELPHQRPPAAVRGQGASAREELCDEALAQRVQLGGGDASAAYAVLVERYEARLVGFLSRRTGSRHDAEDAAQDAFMRAWARIATFDPSRRFSVWLFTIAAREATGNWRKRRNTPTPVSSSGREEAADDRSLGVWRAAERVLDAETMSAVWLRYAADLEPGEIAAVLGRTSVGVRVMLHRARKKIAAELNRWTPAGGEGRMIPGESESGR